MDKRNRGTYPIVDCLTKLNLFL